MTATELLSELEARGIELWAEGDRLRFRAPEGALTSDLRERLAQHRTEVLALLRERGAHQGLEYPLSHQQRSLWFLHQTAPQSAAYNVGFAARVRSTVDCDALGGAVQALVDRHASLRAVFATSNGEPMQRVPQVSRAYYEQVTVPSLDEPGLRQLVAELYRQPFDLRTGPLLRTWLISRSPDDHVLLVTAHHIAVDGWSAYLLIDELRALYESRRTGLPAELPRPAAEYRDFVAWQARTLAEDGDRLWSYWKGQLRGDPAPLEIPADRPRPAVPRHVGATHSFVISADRVQRLKQLTRAEGTTLFVTMLAVFQTLVYRYTGQQDLTVGTPSFGRPVEAMQGVVGHFVNTLPLRLDLASIPTFRGLVHATRDVVLGALAHEAYPFSLMVQRLGVGRDSSRPPLVQVMFALQKAQRSTDLVRLFAPGDPDAPLTVDFGGLALQAFPLAQQEGQFDLMLEVGEVEQSMAANFKFNSDLFDRSTMVRFQAYLETLIDSATSQPDLPLTRLTMVPPEERRLQLEVWSGAGRAWPADRSIQALFEARAATFPTHVAVTCDGRELTRELTYEALNSRANQVAHLLRELGVGPDVLVGMYVERSCEMIVGILGILKAGGAYVPIDPGYPADRARFMLEDAGVAVVLTQTSLVAQLPEGEARLVCLDAPAEFAAKPETNPDDVTSPGDLAYVIYTSGSTGRPKGVQVTHDNVVRLLRATDEWFGFGDRDVWTLFHSYAFDFSVWEIWGALLYGGRLVVVPYWVSRDPASFYVLLRDERVTVLNQTPSAFRQLIAAEPPEADPQALALRYVIFGGEALEPASLRPWVQRHGALMPRLINMYGITETTVHVTYRPLTEQEILDAAPSLIGVPIPDLRLYVLDTEGDAAPVGACGEMYVGGAGVARGYLNRPELTEQRFLPDRFARTGKLYRSGDLARRLPSGDLEYLGRIDHQVKIRGFRIELGEIEAALATCPGVAEAAVLPLELSQGDIRLVGFVIATGAVPDEAGLKNRLRERLPEYMVPSAIIPMDALPLTSNGKLDRRRLLGLATDALQIRGAEATRHPPETEAERIVASVWSEVLKISDLARDDSFFDRGGHSILAVQIVARVRELFGFEVPLRLIFEFHTLRDFAAAIERSQNSNEDPAPIQLVPVPRTTPLAASFTQERLWFIHELWPESPAYHVPAALRLHGSLDRQALRESWRQLVNLHEGLRTRFFLVEERLVQSGDGAVAEIVEIDLSMLDAAEREREFARLSDRHIHEPFDFATDPLVRVTLVTMAADDHLLLFTLHHVICDQWSLGVIVSELAALYSAAAQGRSGGLAQPPVQYADYAVWQRRWLKGERAGRLMAYWRRQLSDLPVLSLPADRPRPAAQSLRGGLVIDALAPALIERAEQFAAGARTTLATSLLTAFAVLLARYTGSTDLPIGIAVANREHSALDRVVGAFINTLVIRVDAANAADFRTLVRHVHDVTTQAYDHQGMPFDFLVAELQPSRDLSRSPLVQVMFNVLNAPAPTGEWHALASTPVILDRRAAQFDLTVHVHDLTGTIAVEYSSDIFEEATIRRLLADYLDLLAVLVDAPGEPLHLRDPERDYGGLESSVGRSTTPDQRAAGVPLAVATPADPPGEPLTTDTERTIAGLWAEVLRRPVVDANSNFFALGGHSLLATQVVGRIRERFGVPLALRRMFEADTLRALAAELDALQAVAALSAQGAGDGEREEIEL
jgi:amino acid adenylation domain-containing protein